MEQLNLICVKWGTAYTPEYVINLYEGAKRYTSHPFNFYVFTDNTQGLPHDRGWRFIKLPEWNVGANRGWWYKMEIFNQQHGIYGRNLYLDLDTVIIGDLFTFWNAIETDNLYICRDFNRQFIRNLDRANSSVMGWRDNRMDPLFRSFTGSMKPNMHRYRGDQDYIDAFQPAKIYWKDAWATSWKWECWHGGKTTPSTFKDSTAKTVINPETKVLVFHGKPKPQFCEDKHIVALWEGKVKHR